MRNKSNKYYININNNDNDIIVFRGASHVRCLVRIWRLASLSSYTNFFSVYDYAYAYCIGETVLDYYLGKVSYIPKEVRVSCSKIMKCLTKNKPSWRINFRMLKS